MEYHFISDDSFFLHGVQGINLPERKKHLLHHAGMLSGKKHPQRGDIVVVNVADITRRKQILQSPWVTYCRVIILLRTKNDGRYQNQRKFPWIIPFRTGQYPLADILVRAATSELVQQSITNSQRLLFHYLCRGYSLSLLEEKMKVTTKYLYTLKLSTMKKFGLSDGHAVGVLLCRDVTGIFCQECYFITNR